MSDFSRVLTPPIPHPTTEASTQRPRPEELIFRKVGIEARELSGRESASRARGAGIYDDASRAWRADDTIVRVAAPRLDGENAADILRVPLFVKVPGQRVGEVSERNAETIDVLPTVVDALGGRLVESVDGVSLFDSEAPLRLRKTVYLWRVTRADGLPQRSYPAVPRSISSVWTGPFTIKV